MISVEDGVLTPSINAQFGLDFFRPAIIIQIVGVSMDSTFTR